MRISDWSSDVCSSDLLAVADLAASGRAQEGRLADGVGREIIVQQEAFPVLAFQRVDDLLVLARAEGGDNQRLRLAAGEQRRAVGPAENADFGNARPHRLGVRPSMQTRRRACRARVFSYGMIPVVA